MGSYLGKGQVLGIIEFLAVGFSTKFTSNG